MSTCVVAHKQLSLIVRNNQTCHYCFIRHSLTTVGDSSIDESPEEKESQKKFMLEKYQQEYDFSQPSEYTVADDFNFGPKGATKSTSSSYGSHSSNKRSGVSFDSGSYSRDDFHFGADAKAPKMQRNLTAPNVTLAPNRLLYGAKDRPPEELTKPPPLPRSASNSIILGAAAAGTAATVLAATEQGYEDEPQFDFGSGNGNRVKQNPIFDLNDDRAPSELSVSMITPTIQEETPKEMEEAKIGTPHGADNPAFLAQSEPAAYSLDKPKRFGLSKKVTTAAAVAGVAVVASQSGVDNPAFDSSEPQTPIPIIGDNPQYKSSPKEAIVSVPVQTAEGTQQNQGDNSSKPQGTPATVSFAQKDPGSQPVPPPRTKRRREEHTEVSSKDEGIVIDFNNHKGSIDISSESDSLLQTEGMLKDGTQTQDETPEQREARL